MYRKCYANITVTICALKPKNVCVLPEIDEWTVYRSLPNAYVLHRIKNGTLEYAPLFCIKIRVNNYKQYSFNAFNGIDDSTFGGSVKKRRIEKHLTIKQVAGKVDISVDTLMRIEKNKYTLYKPDKMSKLCEILNIQPEKICSPYQLFLLNNQGEQILKYRKDNHLSQNALADMLGTSRQRIGTWEKNKNRMPYEEWRKFSTLLNHQTP